eukprot:3795020-Pleurochrysis_carterae.AAC.2
MARCGPQDVRNGGQCPQTRSARERGLRGGWVNERKRRRAQSGEEERAPEGSTGRTRARTWLAE